VSLFFWHTPFVMLGLSVVATCAGLVFGPASGAIVPQLVGKDELARANAMMATGGNIGKTVGRIGSGLVVAAAGFSTVFALNAITFIISAVLIASVSWSSRGATPELGQRLQKMNWRLPFKHDAIRPVLLSSCTATFMTGFSMTAETVLVFDFNAGAMGLGALTACWGAGMVAGSWLAGYALREDNEMNYLLLGRLAMGASIAGVGLTPWFLGTLPCYFIGGAGGGLLLVASQGIMQRNIAQAMLGQLLATTESIKTAALGIGLLAAGTVVAAIGAQHTYLIVGIGVMVGAVPVALAVLKDRAPATQLRLGAAATA
jgi:predicted MFS family arabinose efflux permease